MVVTSVTVKISDISINRNTLKISQMIQLTRSEFFKIHFQVFWVVTLRSVVIGYQRFGAPCCLHLQAQH